MISEQQVRFFDTFGFLICRGWFGEEISDITDEFERVWSKLGGGMGGTPHDGTRRSIFMPFIDQSERLSALLDDPRIHDTACRILGDDFNYVGCDGNLSVGNTGWHDDGREQLRFIRFFFYLDPLDADTGALRVIPGSHKLGGYGDDILRLLSGHENLSAEAKQRRRATQPENLSEEELRELKSQNLEPTERIFGVSGEDVPAAVLSVQPGDVIITDHRIFHASYGGASRRRNFTISLSEHAPAHLMDDLRDWVTFHLRIAKPAPLVGGAMVDGASAERLRHLQQVLDIQDELAERVGPGWVERMLEERARAG